MKLLKVKCHTLFRCRFKNWKLLKWMSYQHFLISFKPLSYKLTKPIYRKRQDNIEIHLARKKTHNKMKNTVKRKGRLGPIIIEKLHSARIRLFLSHQMLFSLFSIVNGISEVKTKYKGEGKGILFDVNSSFITKSQTLDV